ncbi:XVIPCD domain-containing protein [Xanthomonas arboricola]|uniref:XVIPCD domain-containing protein n=1 Tax=Xanthomonas arboricola TaxID=56448 RepID=UPI001E326121|nr:XVIPCD domain-containing protein [Xanthomonas arboricola]
MRQGESIFVIQGALDNPAYLMAHMKTGDAIAQPVAQSSQVQALGQMYRQQQEQHQKPSITPPHRMV